MDVGSITTLPPSGGFPLSGRNYKDPKRLYCRSGGHVLQLFPDGSVRGTQDRGDPHGAHPKLSLSGGRTALVRL